MPGVLAALALAGHLAAAPPPPDPPLACAHAAAVAERRWGLPRHLLLAIGQVESGSWPWSINVAGTGYAFRAVDEADTVVDLFRSHGVASIDVGCFQVNLHYHPNAFASVADGFDPAANGDAAGRFLRALHDRGGGWWPAIAAYHSADAALGGEYRDRVLRELRRLDADIPPSPRDPHVILASASAMTIPVYTPATLPRALRAAVGLGPITRAPPRGVDLLRNLALK